MPIDPNRTNTAVIVVTEKIDSVKIFDYLNSRLLFYFPNKSLTKLFTSLIPMSVCDP